MLAGEHSYRVLWITLGFAASMHGALHYDMTLSQTCSSLDSALLDRDIASLVALAFAWYREAPCCDVKLFTTQAFETALVLHGAPMRRGCSTLYPDECGPFLPSQFILLCRAPSVQVWCWWITIHAGPANPAPELRWRQIDGSTTAAPKPTADATATDELAGYMGTVSI